MSLFDVLNSSGLGSALGTLTEKAKSTASTLGREAPGGVGGLLGAGALGALLGTMLSKDVVKNAALVGEARLPGIFIRSGPRTRGRFRPHRPLPLQRLPHLPLPYRSIPPPCFCLKPWSLPHGRTGILTLRSASALSRPCGTMFPGQDVDSLLNSLMGASLNPASLAARVQSAEQGEDVYRLSCLIVDIDHFMERGYLDGLAQALRIPAVRKEELEREADQARRQLAALPS